MATIAKERGQTNPRMQCSVCGKWMRIHCKPYISKGGYEATQKFFGGCAYSNGDHLANASTGDNDVCDDCCHTECRRVANVNNTLKDSWFET
jgi:hypothetical protein